MMLVISMAANAVLFVVCVLLYRTSVRLARRSSRAYVVQLPPWPPGSAKSIKQEIAERSRNGKWVP